jgi:hypothetical protein
MARTWWEELFSAVNGLRQAVEHSDEDEDAEEPQEVGRLSKNNDQPSNALALGLGTLSLEAEYAGYTSPQLHERLLFVYEDRVDPLVKILHWPTARHTLFVPGQSAQSAEQQALVLAIYFLSLSTLKDDEIPDRALMIEHYRAATAEALARAQLLTSTSLTVLQALVLYLFGLRNCERHTEFWVLVATAVRLASLHGLDRLDLLPAHLHLTMEYQLKKRLWFAIGLQELWSTFDRGTRMQLTAAEFTVFPLDINDTDLVNGQLSSDPARPQKRLTDMSFSTMVYHASLCQRRMLDLSRGAKIPKALEEPGAQRFQILAEFEARLAILASSRLEDMTVAQEFALHCAEDVSQHMCLFLRRPVEKLPGRPPAQDFHDVLVVSTELLERWLVKLRLPKFSKWMWFVWVPWQALAVLLVEVCARRNGPDVDRAWIVGQDAYETFGRLVVDGRAEWIWGPIVKLMRRARAAREWCGPAPSGPTQIPERDHQQNSANLQAPVIPSDDAATVMSRAHTMGQQQQPPPLPGTFLGSASSQSLPPGLMSAPGGVQLPWVTNGQAPAGWTNNLVLDATGWTNWETFVDDLHQLPPNLMP